MDRDSRERRAELLVFATAIYKDIRGSGHKPREAMRQAAEEADAFLDVIDTYLQQRAVKLAQEEAAAAVAAGQIPQSRGRPAFDRE